MARAEDGTMTDSGWNELHAELWCREADGERVAIAMQAAGCHAETAQTKWGFRVMVRRDSWSRERLDAVLRELNAAGLRVDARRVRFMRRGVEVISNEKYLDLRGWERREGGWMPNGAHWGAARTIEEAVEEQLDEDAALAMFVADRRPQRESAR